MHPLPRAILYWGSLIALDLSKYLVVGISSRALFDLEHENEIYVSGGFPAFSNYQLSHESDILKPGAAFPLVEALLKLNNIRPGERRVKVILMSRNHPDVALRVLKSIESYRLDVTRAALTGGTRLAPYLEPFRVDLFLSASDEDVQLAANAGIPAGRIYDVPEKSAAAIDHIRIAFDGDCVLFSDEAQQVYDAHGLEAFRKHEKTNSQTALPPGSFAKLLRTLSEFQGKDLNDSHVQIALVTARDSPAQERAIRTLRAWGVRLDQAFFLGGLPKEGVLEVFQPHIFLDDQDKYCLAAAPKVPTARVLTPISGVASAVENLEITIGATETADGFMLICKPYLKRQFRAAEPQLREWYSENMTILNEEAATSLQDELAFSIRDTPKGDERLQLKGWLRPTLATTNPIESAFSVVDRICKRVKRWRRGDPRKRWVGAGLWLAERNFRRVKGYKQLPKLLAELAKLNTPPPAQARAA